MSMTVSATVQLNDLMSGPINHIMTAVDLMCDHLERVDTALGVGFDSSPVVEIRQHIDMANIELAETAERLNSIEENTRDVTRASREAADTSDGWLNKMAQIGAGYLSIRAVMEGIKTAVGLSDQISQTTARLNLIVDDGGSVDELEARIRASAERSRAPYQTTADAVSKMGMQAGESFNSNLELVAFVELLNKSFVTAGTSVQGVDSVMLQLTQSMAAGKLQGEELNAVLDNAQPIVANIKKYLEEVENIDASNIKELASEGVITADVIKNAMFYAADDINKQFEQMPTTWGQLWVGFVDDVKQAFKPLTDELDELAASENIREMFNDISDAVAVAAVGLAWLTDKLDGFVGAAQENWEIIRPILIGLAAMWAVVTLATLIATIQQWAYNVAMYTCPIVWLIAATIAWIAIIFAANAALAKFTGVADSSFGVICGTVATAGAFVWNVVVGVLNAIIQLIWVVVEVIIGVIEWLINVTSGGFDSLVDAAANAVGQIISWLLGAAKVVTQITDALFGFNGTEYLTSLQEKVTSWGKNENSFTFDAKWHEAPTLQRIEYGNAWGAGAAWGDGVSDKISGFFNFSTENENDPSKYLKEMEESIDKYKDMYSGLGNIQSGTDETAKNTSKIAENTEKTSNLLELVKDNWEKEAIANYTAKNNSITFDMSNMNNTYNNAGEAFNFVKELEEFISGKMEASPEGI